MQILHLSDTHNQHRQLGKLPFADVIIHSGDITFTGISQEVMDLFKRLLAQKKKNKNKVYSLHEVDVECISKGKQLKLYEFGNKVSITRTGPGPGVIVGALSFRNEFDGHTLDKAIDQLEKLTGRKSRNNICDRRGPGKE